MSRVVIQIIVVLIIICIGGFFAASEMALVSLREGQVRALGKRGRRGQKAARLAQDPNRFFSAVQIGVTLATLFSGAYGAETLAGALKSWLIREYQLSPAWAGTVAFIVVTICITFFSLVLGELAPKRIALHADVNAARNIAAGHAVTARGGDGVARPVNREPQLLLQSA